MGVPGQNRTDAVLGKKHRESGFTLIEVMTVSEPQYRDSPGDME